MPKKLSTEEFIARAQAVHGDYYDYSNVEYTNTVSPVSIKCPLHGEWLQRPMHHIGGSGCRNCTMVKNHGAVHPSQKPEAKAKRIRTNMDRYGAAHPMAKTGHTNEARAKRQATFDERYGGHPMKDAAIAQKASSTWKKKSESEIEVIMEKKAKTYLERYGYTNPFDDEDVKAAIYDLRRERGDWAHEDDLPEAAAYKRRVVALTEKAWREFATLIAPDGGERGAHMHLDHRYSIARGFLDGIPADEIAHPANLALIPAEENRAKNAKCSITLSALREAIEAWPKNGRPRRH